jgi:hypothetical protein
MISRPDVAERVSALMLELGAKLDDSVREVGDSCSDEEFSRYRQAVGNIMGTILLDVLNPIYAAHPRLKPKQLK